MARLSRGLKSLKPKKTETILDDSQEQSLVSFVTNCIRGEYKLVFPTIYQEFFQLHILDATWSFLSDENLVALLNLLVKVKTSIGTVLSNRISIDRIDKTNVVKLGDDKPTTGYVFKIKNTTEFDEVWQDAHPELFIETPKIEEE